MDAENSFPPPPTLDEYGEPSPLRVSFCNRMMSEEEYEQQTSVHTKQALDGLFKTMAADPTGYRRILQRRKREEMENGGMLSYLKAQAMYLVGSDDAFTVTDEECAGKLNAMKDEMSAVFHYSEGLRESNGLKRSARLEKKRKLAVSATADTENQPPQKRRASSAMGSAAGQVTSDEQRTLPRGNIPVPPPPPSIPRLPHNLLKPRPKIQRLRKSPGISAADQSKFCGNPQPSIATTGVSPPMRALRSNNKPAPPPDRPQVTVRPACNFLAADMLVERKKRLRTAPSIKSPGGTPTKKRYKTAVHAGSPASLFNEQLVNKFRNARSPSPPRPEHNNNASFNDSLGSSSWLSPEVISKTQPHKNAA